ncbi:MAG: hypothetical protein ACRELG_24160 [Gemmataceae bacterium]
MVQAARGLLILAILAGLFGLQRGFGQSPPAPDDAPSETLPTLPQPLEAPPSVETPAPSKMVPGSAVPLFAPANPPILAEAWQENGTLGPAGQWLGWYANIDAALIDPHIDSHLDSGSNIKAPFLTQSTPTGSVQTSVPPGSNADVINAFGHPITLPIAPLDWTISPFVRVGYRLANGAGDLRLDWRMVASQGNSTIPDFDAAGTGLLQSRVNVQFARLTYGTSEFSPGDPKINRTWAARVGVAAADVFFDSQAHGQQILLQQASNSFAGIGPTLAFTFWKPLTPWGISLYGEVNATGLIGDTRQHFGETILVDGQTYSDFAATGQQSNGVGILGTQGGFSYAPWQDRTWRFTLGYQWQRWWWAGATSDSNAALTLQGFFLRTEWRY